ncbi:hypothetical protein JW872_02795 [Candidatus Babeliales bacterium]|nr:hypothetical protein [Candidatus Babeliales bacterium]
MKRTTTMTKLKNLTKVLLLLFVVSSQGQFVRKGLESAPAIPTATIPDIPVTEEMVNHQDAAIERITFQAKAHEASDEMITRNGYFVKRKNAPATILVCHGYMCDKFDIAFIRTIFSKYNCMTFDFRAHGEGIENQQCTFGKEEAFDVIGAVEYLKTRPEVAGKPIISYAFSMGSVSSIEAQAREPMFDAMILDCPFDSSDNLIKKGLSNLKLNILGYEFKLPGQRMLQKYAYSPYVQSLLKAMLKAVAKFDARDINTNIMPVTPVTSASKISVPCYFITCKNDEKVSVEAVTSVFSKTTGYKRLWITNGRRHFDSFFYNPEKYMYEVNTFVQKAIKGSLKHDHSAKIFADPDEDRRGEAS